jgi:hypothetical protein
MKSFEELVQDIGRWESGNNWQARRPGSQYIGYFQFGDAAFNACKSVVEPPSK